MQYKDSFLVLILLFHFYLLSGQLNHLEFANISHKQGLSNSNINAIVQDKDGFIWFGTDYGLDRYDGYQIKVYRNIPGDSTSIPDNFINCLYVDYEGTLWIGTMHGGLCCYNKNLNVFLSYSHNPLDPHSISYNYITCITEDTYHNLWVATLEGLNRYNKKDNNFLKFNNNSALLMQNNSNTLYVPSNDCSKYLVSNHIRFITAGKNCDLWIGYERDGLGMLDVKRGLFTHYPLPASLQKTSGDNSIQFILEYGNELWLASRFSGVLVFNKISKSYEILNIKEIDSRVTFLLLDNKNMWIATKNGLYYFKKQSGSITSYFHQECNYFSISNNSISCLLKDRQGILWAGSMQGGVNYVINKKGFNTFKKELCKQFSLSQQSVSVVTVDRKNKLWIGYFDNGVDIIDKKTFKKKSYYDLPTRQGTMQTGSMFAIFEDSKGRIWLGSYASGLFLYEPETETFRNFNHNPLDTESLSGNDIRSICEDKDHQLWLAIHGKGINRFNPETGKSVRISFPQNNFGISPGNNWVYKIYVDNENNLWVTSVEGLSFSNDMGNSFTNYRHSQKYFDKERLDEIFTLYDDGKQLWLGSSTGISTFDKKRKMFTKTISKNDGLPSDAIAGILADAHNYLWISTYNGLVKLNPKTFKVIKVYDQTDGLQGEQFLSNACYRSSSGEMYFGGQDGLTAFFPDSIREYRFVPPIVLTDFKLFNKSENFAGSKILKGNISQIKEITLKYSQNVITFDFVALNFEVPEKNQYAFRLEGFEKDWNVMVNKREATYTNLSPGNYVFRVKASNNDGIWNNEGTSLKIKVLPPFWLSYIAFILYFIMVIFGLILYKRLILKRETLKRKLALQQLEAKKQIEMNNMRLQFFTNISHEFRTSLSLIIGPTESLLNEGKNITNSQKEFVTLIKNNAHRLLRLINQLLDLRKIETGNIKLYPSLGDLISFCRNIAASFQHLALQKQLSFQIIAECNTLYAWFDSDKLEKILYNLLSNAFKYTPEGGSVKFSITLLSDENPGSSSNQSVCIEIADTGIGIPQEFIDKVFERFYQVNTPEHSVKGGTGIGLSLVKELVEMHHGTIKVKSNPQKPGESFSQAGTIFTVILPLDLKGPVETTIVSQNSEEIKNVSKPNDKKNKSLNPLLLIVEDNSDLRIFINGIMKNDFRVIEANNGIEGLNAAIHNNPDLIISDIMMPGMLGTDLCLAIKTDERTSHIPIILLTALSSTEQKISGLETGADDYITKPFSAEILKTRVQNLIETRRRMREQFSKHILVEPKEISITSPDENFIKRAIDIIEKHMDDSLFDVEKFSSEMFVSRTLLHTKLKAITDLSATEFIKTIRLKRAYQLLKEGRLGVSEVSTMVGFNSRNYFTKCFTEFFGINPSDYLKPENMSNEFSSHNNYN